MIKCIFCNDTGEVMDDEILHENGDVEILYVPCPVCSGNQIH